eukprot:TRINITY_DN434_c0_g1_i1.p1 TRINITY_DN434_c0_g1~~TRINITY_DN434_c0_g1_i1.p1  ORF type:complete len:253 (-),score=90.26 TRINITY_DN434_c0_g1_i1:425-1183(-)
MGNMVLSLWDCGGQDRFMESYFESQREYIFTNVEVLIYVFDIESPEREKDINYFKSSLEALKSNSPNAKVFCLIHKMDVILTEEERLRIFEDRQIELKKIVAPLELECFRTSIWDETLYKAWSAIVHSLVPNKRSIEKNLTTLCQLCDADEIVLFEKATFLVISHAHQFEHSDSHRFEKISNIVKQFKLSCGNAHAQFVSLEVRNSNFSAFIDAFTSTTYIMVVMSDPKINSAATLMNIDVARNHFEKLIKT